MPLGFNFQGFHPGLVLFEATNLKSTAVLLQETP
jgi:hypothetical protein